MRIERIKYETQLSFELLGISSTENDYVLAWYLSRLLNCKFYLQKSFTITREQAKTGPLFSGDNIVIVDYNIFGNMSVKSCESDVWLVSNRNYNSYLIEEFRNFDYLLLKRNSSVYSLQTLLNFSNVSASKLNTFLIDISAIKSKQMLYLLWDSLQNKQ